MIIIDFRSMEQFIPKLSDIFPFKNPQLPTWTVEIYLPLDNVTSLYRVSPTSDPTNPDHFCLEITSLNFNGSLESGPSPSKRMTGRVPKTVRPQNFLRMADVDEEIGHLLTSEPDLKRVFLGMRADYISVAQNVPSGALAAVSKLAAQALFSDAIRNYYRKPETLDNHIMVFGREVGGSIVLGLWKNNNSIERSMRGRGLEHTEEFRNAKLSRAVKFPDISSMQRQLAPQVKLMSLMCS